MKKTTRTEVKTVTVTVCEISVHDFLDYLSSHNLLVGYLTALESQPYAGKNVLQFIRTYLRPIDAFDGAFGWYRTVEGHDFWSNAQAEWLNWLKNNNVQSGKWEEEAAE